MSDQTKYTNKLNGKHVLVIGGSAGSKLLTLVDSNDSYSHDHQESATESQKQFWNMALV